jgi:hypothetical protein
MLRNFYGWLRPEYDRMPGIHKVTNTLLLTLRRVLITAGFRPDWQEQFGHRLVWINFSDDFSIHRRLFPRYGQNLGAIARLGRQRDPEFRMIDIGASFGDGVAAVLGQVQIPILAVEPSSNFDKLKRNFGVEPGIELVRAFVGGKSSLLSGQAPTLSLASILERHPSSVRARLLKIDTDGHDLSILRENKAWLRSTQPVIFFEYDPHWPVVPGAAPTEIFQFLGEIGYERAMVYDLTGLFMLELALSARESWEQLTSYLQKTARISYLDICAFSASDNALAEDLLAEEMANGRPGHLL